MLSSDLNEASASALELFANNVKLKTGLIKQKQKIQDTEVHLPNAGRTNSFYCDELNQKIKTVVSQSNAPHKSDRSASIDSIQFEATADRPARGHAYTNAYSASFQIELNDSQRDKVFFLSDEPVVIQIIGHEEEPSLVLLHTNVYTIHIKHGEHAWTIKRKYKNFLKLYEAYALFKTKLNIRNAAAAAHLTPNLISASTNHNDSLNQISDKKFKHSDHFKLLFQSIASDFDQAKHILEKFLQDVVDHKTFRNHNESVSWFLICWNILKYLKKKKQLILLFQVKISWSVTFVVYKRLGRQA